MKTRIIAIFSFCALALTTNAQVEPNAIGARLESGIVGLGAELSYQHGFGESNRLELDAGFKTSLSPGQTSAAATYNYTSLTAAYHWYWNIVAGFGWFIGPAVQGGLYFTTGLAQNELGPTVAGGAQGGVEYNFNHLGVPLQVSVDARPLLGLYPGGFGYDAGGAVGVRYTF